jgi:hypothetical protein
MSVTTQQPKRQKKIAVCDQFQEENDKTERECGRE